MPGGEKCGDAAEAVVIAMEPDGAPKGGAGRCGAENGVEEETKLVHCGLRVAPVSFLRADHYSAFQEPFDGAALDFGLVGWEVD